MRKFKGYIALCLVLGLVWPVAPGAADDEVSFSGKGQFSFGMLEQDGDKLLENYDDWEIAYRIKTPSTMDVSCRYKQSLYFQARFYKGRCYFVEKRMEAQLEQVKAVFDEYFDEHGESPEATQSSDGRLYFASWDLDGREILLTADMRSNGNYIITLEDMLPEIIGEANKVQERELAEMPADVDPVTGRVRHHIHNADGEEQE